MTRSLFALLLAGLATQASALPILQNTSFETNNVGSGYLYSTLVVAAPWAFADGAGISHNGTAWLGTTTYGDYFAFMQQTSSLSQSFVSDGNYDIGLSFAMVERTSGYSPDQVVQVWFDGVLQTSINPTSNWVTYSLPTLSIAAGSHTLEFRGIYTGADASAFIDNVQMSATASAVPEPAALGLLGLGLLGLGMLRRARA